MNKNFERKTINLNQEILNSYMLEIITDLNKISFNKKLIQGVVKNYTLKITSSKKQAGLCHYKNKTISISNCSDNLQNKNIDIKKEIKNTLLHEFLHAMYPGAGHRGKWKAAANIINYSSISNNYGTIQRCYEVDTQTKNLTKSNEKYKYKIECKKCEYTYNFKRKTKYMNLRSLRTNYICPHCKKSLDLKIL